MPVNVISTIKPKNNGTFPIVEAPDVKVTNDKRLDAVYSDITATLDGYVTPQKFGAVGDGTTDDTNAFQSAIASGNKIFIPKGEYKITSRLSIPSGTVLTGDGVGTVIKSYDDDGTFLIGDNVIIEKFRVSVESISTSGNVFEISEDSLSDCELVVPALNTIVNAIDVVWNVEECTHCAVFSLSCEATFGTHDLTGFYAVRITNCSSLSTADKNVGYFARMYSRNGKWVTGCEVENCNIYGCRWAYMSGYSDETSDLTDTTTKGCDGLLLNRIQHQCTTNTRGFFYIRNNESVNVTDCIPWDWGYCTEDEFKNHPYVMPSSRYNRTNAVQSKPIDISPKPPSNQFLMLKSDGTFKKLVSADAYLVHQATGKTDLFLPNLAKPMQLGNGENNFTWLYFNGKITTDSYVIKFRLIIDGITSDVTMYMGDNPFDHENISPYILCDNIPSGVSFLYRCDNYDEFYLYIKKNSGNFTAKDVAISYPVASANQGYSGISGMANKIGTINTYNYGADSRYLSETPNSVTTITNVKTINQDKKYLSLGDGENNSSWIFFSGKLNTDFYAIKMKLIIGGETIDLSMFMGEHPFDHENIAPYIIADRIPSNITFRYRTNQYDEFYLFVCNSAGNFTRMDYAIVDDIAAMSTSKNKIGTVNVFSFGESRRFESGTPYDTQKITDISQENEGGTTANRPTSSLQLGKMYFDTTLGKPVFWNGTKWTDSSGVDNRYLSLGDGNNNSSWLFFSGKLNTDFYAIKMKLLINGETIDLSVFMGEHPFDHENIAPYIVADRIPSNISFRYRTNVQDEFYLFVCNSTGNFTTRDYAIIDDVATLSTSKNKIGTVNTFSFGESLRFESETPYSTKKITDISQKNEGGNTTNRPTSSLQVGEMYFDTTLGKPIFWNGTKWVDSSGTDVE